MVTLLVEETGVPGENNRTKVGANSFPTTVLTARPPCAPENGQNSVQCKKIGILGDI
jgi:hypothetical protein